VCDDSNDVTKDEKNRSKAFYDFAILSVDEVTSDKQALKSG